ncbi:unnamed protein product, partial [Onchocerca ochengi]|uniref:Uncharacterized protein n=1 Tax=Onchocerca ochengi TaxID=42157 RepID=A0A182EZT4_ONCOC
MRSVAGTHKLAGPGHAERPGPA